ncbi:hypothetical protein Syun_001195 [Stephania yunnanensis]|uniref:Uncharacterized protein n=1 Tax=Stephania yunnanensis TaxID=152371 RepID=A0AAP0LEA2_9MAGN
MHMYLVTNTENMKLFEQSQLDECEESFVLPTVHDLVPSEAAKEDLVLNTKIGKNENSFQIVRNGTLKNKSKRIFLT